MSKDDNENVITRNPYIRLRRTPTGFFGYDCLNGDLFEVNPDAKVLWDLCVAPITLDELNGKLKERVPDWEEDTEKLAEYVDSMSQHLFLKTLPVK